MLWWLAARNLAASAPTTKACRPCKGRMLRRWEPAVRPPSSVAPEAWHTGATLQRTLSAESYTTIVDTEKRILRPTYRNSFHEAKMTKQFFIGSVIIIALIIGAAVLIRSSIQRTVRLEMAGKCDSVGLALEMYVEKYGKLPPYVVLGPNGQPYHSWRTLLMEFISTELHKEYDFTLPWNHENNRKVALRFNPYGVSGTATCQLFRVRLDRDAENEAALNRRFLLIEHRAKNVLWTEPIDLVLEDLDDVLLRDEPFVYVFRGGHTRLRADADPSLVKEAFTKRLDAPVLRSLMLYSTASR
jgi:hypothetical protein